MTRLDEESLPEREGPSNGPGKSRDSFRVSDGQTYEDPATPRTVNLFVPDDSLEKSPSSPRQHKATIWDLRQQPESHRRQSSNSSSSDVIAPLELVRVSTSRPVLKKSNSQAQMDIQSAQTAKPTKPKPLLKSLSQSNISQQQRFQPTPSNSSVKKSILKRSDSCSRNSSFAEEASAGAVSLSRKPPSRQLSFADDKKKPLAVVHHVPDTHYPTRKHFCIPCCSIQ